MSKLKTHSGTKKRLKVTTKGKVLRRHAAVGHFLQKKGPARKRRFAGVETLKGRQVKNVKRRLGI